MDQSPNYREDLLDAEELKAKFGLVNYVVFGLMLLVSGLIGVYYGWRGQKNTEEFLLGGRSMGTLPMTMSLFASFISAVALLGIPSEIYTAGTQYTMVVCCFPFVMFVVIKVYLPVFDLLRVTTSYQYLEMRFNKGVMVLASTLFCVQMLLYMAIVVYAPALALVQVTGFLSGVEYDVETACVVIILVCMFYTAIGGIKAVMWTDTFQVVCMFGSFIAVLVMGVQSVGGVQSVFERNYKDGRVELFNLDPDIRQRHTFWGTIIGMFFLWVALYGTNQAQVQRYLSVKTRSQAEKSLWLNSVLIIIIYLLCCFAGMLAYTFYHNCDPVKSQQVQRKDQIFPVFVMQMMGDYPGIPGIFVAGVISGALSTVSSGLNSLAAVCVTQLGEMQERRKTLVSKLLAIFFGFVCLGITFLCKYLPGVIQASTGISSMVGGPVLGLFTLGMLVPFATSAGALAGTFVSMIFTFWWGFGQMVAVQMGTYDSARFSPMMNSSITSCPPSWNLNKSAPLSDSAPLDTLFLHLPLYDLSYTWFAPFSCLLCLVVGIIVSLCNPADHRQLDRRLISPGYTTLFSWWPPPIRRRVYSYYQEVGDRHQDLNSDLQEIK